MNGIIADILKELENNKHDHRFPVHVVAQAGVVCEASGLLMTEALRMKYQTAEEQERGPGGKFESGRNTYSCNSNQIFRKFKIAICQKLENDTSG
jgi:hypothetical protein